MAAKKPKVKTTTRQQGHKFSHAKREELYAGILKHHVLEGLGYRETASVLGVDVSTIVYHTCKLQNRPTSAGFIDWMKLRHPERFDRDYIVNRFLDRSEQRRSDAMYEFAKNQDTSTRLKALKEMREEDSIQLKVLQDVGVVEAKSEQHAQVPVTFTWGVPPPPKDEKKK